MWLCVLNCCNVFWWWVGRTMFWGQMCWEAKVFSRVVASWGTWTRNWEVLGSHDVYLACTFPPVGCKYPPFLFCFSCLSVVRIFILLINVEEMAAAPLGLQINLSKLITCSGSQLLGRRLDGLHFIWFPSLCHLVVAKVGSRRTSTVNWQSAFASKTSGRFRECIVVVLLR